MSDLISEAAREGFISISPKVAGLDLLLVGSSLGLLVPSGPAWMKRPTVF